VCEYPVMNTTIRRRALVGLVAISLSIVGACSDDGDDSPTVESGSDTTSLGGQDAAATDDKDYCAASLAIETVPEPDIDFDSLSPEQQQAEAKKFAKESLRPLADKVLALAPEKLDADYKVLNDGLKKVEETGDFGAFESPEISAAEQKVHAYDLENCGWQKVDVNATEYAFAGVPATVKSGSPVSFEFANKGKELHELVLIRKNDDTKETFAELLEIPEEEARKKTTSPGGTFAAPGQPDYLLANLTPGEYMAICFIPVGLTPEAAEAAENGGSEPQGPPHFTRGMKTEFKVS
jgi:uncharacterized cupredoxin-like copper-binding protein